MTNVVCGECGTKEYLPLEVINSIKTRDPYDPTKVDSFTIGICLFILAFGSLPFKKASEDNELYKLIMLGKYE